MGYNPFNQFGTSAVVVEFECDQCAELVISEKISVPEPYYGVEKSSDSWNQNSGYAVCGNCEKNFDVLVNAGMNDSYVDVDGIEDESVIIEEIPDEYLEFYNDQINAIISKEVIDQFKNEIENLNLLNSIQLKQKNIQEILFRQVYSGAITCLEDYLYSTLVQKVFRDKKHFVRFVETNNKLNKIYA